MTKIDVPTNGSRGPGHDAGEPSRDEDDDTQSLLDNGEDPAADYTVAVSPRQLAAGFAIVAAVLVLLVRRRRKG